MKLTEEVEVGSLGLRNRIVMPPMATGLATEKGEVTDELIDHYSSRAPWLGLIIVEHSYVHPEGRLSSRQLGIYDDSLVPGLEELSSSVKEEGTPVCIQINHAGAKAEPGPDRYAVGPSADENAHQLTEAEISEVVESFGKAAARAVSAGFDAVEVHGAHGFLLNQFTSPVTNRRQDSYGGYIKNRMRFPLMVVDRVRRETNGEAQLWYRLGADDRNPRGNSTEDAAKMARMLVDSGVEVVDVSGGVCGSRPTGLSGPGYFAYAAQAVKDVVDVPVVAVGGIRTPEDAERILSEWNIDLVAVGRALLEDPEWGRKAQE